MTGEDWITATTDRAHAENWAGIHASGFCKACANLYTALNHVATDQLQVAVAALREIDHACTLGAERLGMSPDGVSELRRIAQRGIGEQSAALPLPSTQAPKETA